MAKLTCPGCKQSVELADAPPIFTEIPPQCGTPQLIDASGADWPLLRWKHDGDLQSFAKKQGLDPAHLQAWYNKFYGEVHCPACYKELAEVRKARRRIIEDPEAAVRVARPCAEAHAAEVVVRISRKRMIWSLLAWLVALAFWLLTGARYLTAITPTQTVLMLQGALALALFGAFVVAFFACVRAESRIKTATTDLATLLEAMYAGGLPAPSVAAAPLPPAPPAAPPASSPPPAAH
ncbi:MAG: hypothetical protein HZA54_00015 [Planctomycetes bacterium]|nr:hypothetical protein [Planctomycetota bacterium]